MMTTMVMMLGLLFMLNAGDNGDDAGGDGDDDVTGGHVCGVGGSWTLEGWRKGWGGERATVHNVV